MIGLVYWVLLLIVGCAFYMCCLYGILFTPEQSRAWVIASLVAFSIDIVLQEPLVQLLKVIVLFLWKLGDDSARAIIVASVAARAGIDGVQYPEATDVPIRANQASQANPPVDPSVHPPVEAAASSSSVGLVVTASAGAVLSSEANTPMSTGKASDRESRIRHHGKELTGVMLEDLIVNGKV